MTLRLPDHDQAIATIAKTCHDVNRAYCQALGDDSLPAWEDAPGWQRQSIINGVLAHINHPEMTPEDSHRSWLHAKDRDGWKWGPEKDVEAKRHPCMVPYSELPREQQVKDHLFRAVVHSLVHSA